MSCATSVSTKASLDVIIVGSFLQGGEGEFEERQLKDVDKFLENMKATLSCSSKGKLK